MKNRSNTEHFFFLVVDDGGFQHSWPDNRGELIDFSAYENIVRLAQSFKIQIVLSCTTRYLDIDRVSTNPSPHKDSKRLIKLIEKYSEHIVVADHGYNHQLGNSYYEFRNNTNAFSPSYRIQKDHIEQSMKVYRSLGWPVPKFFVPPAHGWEPGVTDALYAQYGVKYLSSLLNIGSSYFSKIPLKKSLSPNGGESIIQYPKESDFLTVLPRLGLGIPHHIYRISSLRWCRAYQSVLPTPQWFSSMWHKHKPDRPHNYMAHIANFSHKENLEKWSRFLTRLQGKPCYLAKSLEESIQLWKTVNSEVNERV